LQATQVDPSEIRADARRLAEESGSIGQIWEGQPPDDFEPIEGIGKVFEQRLYAAGIRTYRALADASPEQLAAIVKAQKPLQPDYRSWIAQARRRIGTS
jgi:predicted flap endonuclease-1-like 5' DNA nuclease